MRAVLPFTLIVLVAAGLAACGQKEPAPAETGAAGPSADATAKPPADGTAKPPADEAPTAPEGDEATGPRDGPFPGDRVPAFSVAGREGGRDVTLDSQKVEAVTVYCVTSVNCPTTRAYAEKLRGIESSFAPKGVKFVWLYPNRTETDADKAKCQEERQLGGVFSVDRDAVVARKLAADHTPTMLVVARDGTITYRGAVDDGNGDPADAKRDTLTEAIEATLAGRDVALPSVPPAG